MAWIFSTLTKNARANAIDTELGVGGKLEIYTTAYGTLLATWTWTGNVFAYAAGGIMNMNAPSVNPVTPAVNGVAVIAKLVTSADVAVVSDLTVGTSGTDVIVTNTAFATTAPETLNSVTVTEA